MGDSRARVHLRQIAVRNQCTVDWNGMRGGDAVRFCGSCKSNVYNLSEMTEQDVEQLLARGDDICVRYYYRPDGTIVTSACPPAQRRSPGVAAATVAGALVYTSAFVGVSAIVAGTDAGDVAMRDTGVKVAMGGIKLIVKTPKHRDRKQQQDTPTEREPIRSKPVADVIAQGPIPEAQVPVSLAADEPEPALSIEMPVQPAAHAHMWPAVLLALGAVLGVLFTSWLAFGIASAGGAAAFARRLRAKTKG